MSALLVTVVALPAVGGALLLLLGRLLPGRAAGAAGPAATVLLAAAAALGVRACLEGAAASAPFLLGVDLTLSTGGLASLVLPVVLVVGVLVQLAATATAQTRAPRFCGLMLLFVAAAAVTVLAVNLPTLLLGWEVMGATSYALIGYRFTEPHRVESGAIAFLTTRAADLGLYVAVAGGLAAGGLDLTGLADLAGPWRDVVAAGLLVAALGKAAQLPFSFWLSRAMDGPSPVSALLHSAAMVALGGYLLLRVAPLLSATGWAADAAAWLGVTTAVALGAVALAQTDLKQLLAASTAAQMGFVVLAAGVGATSAGAAHLVGHAAVKALLFLAAGAWLEAVGSSRLVTLTGVVRRWPAVGLMSVAALLSLAGLPPLTLWATKDAVLVGALERSPALYVAGLLAAALSTAYAVTALAVLTRPAPTEPPTEPTGAGEEQPAGGGVAAVVPVALAPLALGAVGLGLLALPAVLTALPGEVPAEAHGWELVASGVLALGVGALVLLRQPADLPAGLQAWLGLERAAYAVVVRPVLRGAELAARADDRLLARAVDAVGSGGLRLARLSAAGDTAISRAVSVVAGGFRSAGAAVRRPSATGQVHHYFLQLCAGVLAILAVLTVAVLVGSPR